MNNHQKTSIFSVLLLLPSSVNLLTKRCVFFWPQQTQRLVGYLNGTEFSTRTRTPGSIQWAAYAARRGRKARLKITATTRDALWCMHFIVWDQIRNKIIFKLQQKKRRNMTSTTCMKRPTSSMARLEETAEHTHTHIHGKHQLGYAIAGQSRNESDASKCTLCPQARPHFFISE